MYNTMYKIKSKKICCLKLYLFKYIVFQKNLSFLLFLFVRYNKICKSLNFPELRVHYTKYKNTVPELSIQSSLCINQIFQTQRNFKKQHILFTSKITFQRKIK